MHGSEDNRPYQSEASRRGNIPVANLYTGIRDPVPPHRTEPRRASHTRRTHESGLNYPKLAERITTLLHFMFT